MIQIDKKKLIIACVILFLVLANIVQGYFLFKKSPLPYDQALIDKRFDSIISENKVLTARADKAISDGAT